MKKILSLCLVLGAFMILAQQLSAQRTITGTVTDNSNGEGIPGATVVVEGTNVGTAADFEGKYRLANVPEGAVLLFSATGFVKQSKALGASNVINIALAPDIAVLEDVVVTAMGIERDKKRLTYSIESIDGDKVAQKSEPDVLRALSGKIPGLQVKGSSGAPGSSTSVVFRGYSTTNTNQPLFIVDGVPYDNGVASTDNTLISGSSYSNRAVDLNPADIETYSFLKGGAAAALYGSRAANGVIIITTKAGAKKKGVSQRGLNVTLSSSYTVQKVAKLPKFQNEYGQGAQGIFNNGFFGTWGPAFSELDSVIDFRGDKVPYRAYPDNVKDFYQVGGLLENSVGVSQVGENYNVSASFTATEHKGIIPNTEFTRQNFNVGGNVSLDNGLTIGGSIAYNSSKQLGPQVGGGGVADGSVHRVLWFIPRSYDLSGYPFQDQETKESLYHRNGVLNPYWVAKENPYTSNVQRVAGNMNASINIAPWLNASYRFGYNTYSDRRKQVYAVGNVLAPNGQILLDDVSFREVESTFLLTATKELGGNFALRAILGHNLNERTFDQQRVQGTGILAYGIDDLDNTAAVVPFLGRYTQRRLFGVFGDVELSYNNFLILNVTGRNDWSSTLPIQNRSFFYPSASLAFIFTDAFDMSDSFLSFGKIRGGWSRVANDAGVYLTESIFGINGAIGNNLAGITPPFKGVSVASKGNTLGNDDIRPEFTNEFEMGADLNFIKGRIGLNFTYYNRKTTDLITNITVPATSGYLGKIINAGSVRNQGIEIGLDLTPVETEGGFRWNMFSAFSRNQGEVLSLANDQEQIDALGSRFGSRGQVFRVGLAPLAIEGSKMLRDDQGNLLIDPNNGLPIASQTPEIIGDPEPDFLLGVTNTLSWKGLSFSFLIDTQVGGDMYIGTISQLRGRGVLEETAVDRDKLRIIEGVYGDSDGNPILVNGKTVANTVLIDANTFWFRGPSGFAADESAIFDATTIRLRELSLAYQFPESLMKKTPFGSASVAFTARNLWFYTPNIPTGAGIDPEAGGQPGNLQAMIQNYVPNTKSYGVNFKVTF